MKRIVFLLFATMFVGQVEADDFTIGNLKYTIMNAKEHYVSVSRGVGLTGDIEIPATVKRYGTTYTVVSIGSFYECDGITSITIPSTVGSIGAEYAFYGCTKLTKVEFASIESFCKMIYHDIYSNPLLYAHHLYIDGEEVTHLEIPNTISYINDYAFVGCSSLTSVTIPNTVTKIGINAFSYSGLTTIVVPESVTWIDNGAFCGCSSLKSMTLPLVSGTDSHQFTLGYLFGTDNKGGKATVQGDDTYYIPQSLKSVTITRSSNIPPRAFQNCSGLTSISIPKYTKSIGQYAFYNCSGLTTITIPDSVTTIGVSSFYGCVNLTSVTIPNSVTSIEDNLFYGCSSLTAIAIGDRVTRIGKDAFNGCSNLMTITIPNSVTSICGGALNGCSSLNSITLPFVWDGSFGCVFGTNSYTGGTETIQYYKDKTSEKYYIPSSLKSVTITDGNNIPYGAFYNCGNLTSISISNSVKNIGQYAFYNCRSLSSILIPNSVKSIGKDAFNQCFNLTKAEFASVESLCGIRFSNSSANPLSYARHLYVGGEEITNLKIPNTIKYIDVYAFVGCNNIQTLTFNTNAVGSLFKGMTSLKRINIGDSVTNIAADAFRECDSLISITIGNSVTEIGGSAFYGCNNLAEAEYASVESLCGIKFSNSSANPLSYARHLYIGGEEITNLEIPSTIKYIDKYAFAGCNNIQTLTYNTSAVDTQFKGLTSLKRVIIGDSVTNIAAEAFENCDSIVSVYISESVTSIGNNAFYGCDNLTKAEFASIENLCRINFAGFASNPLYYAQHLYINGTEITNLEIPNSVTNIGNLAFCNCRGLISITIPKSVVSIGDYAFYNCNSLTKAEFASIGSLCETSFGNEYANPLYYAQHLYIKGTEITNLEIPDSVTSFSDCTFCNCSYLTSVIIGSSVKSVGLLYFKNKGIRYRVLNKDSVEVAPDSYYGQIVIPDSVTAGNTFIVTSIGNDAFRNCIYLTSVAIPYSVTNIGKSAFYGCTWLSATIPNSVTSIGQDAFYACRNVYCEATSDSLGGRIYGYMDCKVINLVVNNAGFGYTSCTGYAVKAADGSFWYLNNAKVTLTATPYSGYHVRWEDNSIENVRTFNATESKTYTAAFEEYTEVVDASIAPTCTETGLTEGKHCGNCGAVVLEQKIIPAYGHTEVVDSAIVSTCTESGLTEGKHCAVCGETIVAQEVIPANGHTEVTDAAVAATCTESGLTEGKHCSVCGETIVAQEVIPANGHTEVVDAAVAATCTATGLTKGKHCSVCGVVLVAQTKTPKVAHTIVTDAAVAATSTETGLTEGSHCSVCGAVIVAQEVVPTLGNPGTAISESAITNLQVYAHGNTIIVENATDEIRVYNAMGALVGRDVACRVRAELQVNGAGVYIVKVGTVAKRVMIND